MLVLRSIVIVRTERLRACWNFEVMEESMILKAQIILRLVCVVFLVMTACIVGLDNETRRFLSSFEKKATIKDLYPLVVLTIVESVAAGYNLLQLISCFIVAPSHGDKTSISRAWLYLLLDQLVTYLSFATNSVVAQASILALTGISELQWLKMCNTYTRFCIQIAGGIVSGFLASLAMILVSFISAFNLFRFYSPAEFLLLKHR